MHPELIKAEIRMKGTTPSAIADELGITRAAVAQTITGQSKSARIRAHIAKLLHKPVAVIWPEGTKPYPGVRRRALPKVARDEHGFPIGATDIGRCTRTKATRGEPHRAAVALGLKEEA